VLAYALIKPLTEHGPSRKYLTDVPPSKVADQQTENSIIKVDYFQSKQGLWIYTRKWITKKNEKAVVFLTHGVAEHVGRYEFVADYLNQQGYSVYGLDLQGHGRSGGDRGYVSSYHDYETEVIDYIHRERASISTKTPVFLLGHSNGGLISILVAQHIAKEIKGVVLSGPALGLDPSLDTPTMRKLVAALSSAFPKIPASKLDNTYLSRDSKIKDTVDNDDLHYKGSLSMGLASAFLDILTELEHQEPVTWPFLLLYTKQDRLISPSACQKFYDNAQSKDKTVKVYEDLYHEIFNEPEKEEFLSVVVSWLNNHV